MDNVITSVGTRVVRDVNTGSFIITKPTIYGDMLYVGRDRKWVYSSSEVADALSNPPIDVTVCPTTGCVRIASSQSPLAARLIDELPLGLAGALFQKIKPSRAAELLLMAFLIVTIIVLLIER